MYTPNLTKNTNLTYLDLSTGQVQGLNLSSNVLLETVKVSGNKLTAVDISMLPLLKDFEGGKQTDGVAPRQMTLTMTAEQKANYWDPVWSLNPLNEGITVEVK